MRAVVQRVSNARVDIDGATAGSIGRGLLILLGVGHDDSEEQAERLWSKIARLRIFEDAEGKTNLSLADVGGEVLVAAVHPVRELQTRQPPLVHRGGRARRGEPAVPNGSSKRAPRRASRGIRALRRLHGREPDQRRSVHAVARHRRALARRCDDAPARCRARAAPAPTRPL